MKKGSQKSSFLSLCEDQDIRASRARASSTSASLGYRRSDEDNDEDNIPYPAPAADYVSASPAASLARQYS